MRRSGAGAARTLTSSRGGDPRFAAHYDGIEPGLARYARDAIVASADRREPAG